MCDSEADVRSVFRLLQWDCTLVTEFSETVVALIGEANKRGSIGKGPTEPDLVLSPSQGVRDVSMSVCTPYLPR